MTRIIPISNVSCVGDGGWSHDIADLTGTSSQCSHSPHPRNNNLEGSSTRVIEDVDLINDNQGNMIQKVFVIGPLSSDGIPLFWSCDTNWMANGISSHAKKSACMYMRSASFIDASEKFSVSPVISVHFLYIRCSLVAQSRARSLQRAFVGAM